MPPKRPPRPSAAGWAPGWTRSWLRESGSLAGTHLTAVVVTTALAVVIARYLGPDDFGVFAGFLGLSQVLMLLAALGVATWLLRDLSQLLAAEQADHRLASELVSASVALTAGMALILTSGSLLAGLLLGSSGDLAVALVALMGYMGLLTCATVLEVVFRAHRRLSRLVIATFLEKLFLALAVTVAVLSGTGIAGIAAAYVAAGVLRLAWDLWAIRASGLITLSRPTPDGVRSVVRSSIPFGLGTATPTAIVRLDIFLIGLISSSSAGLFAVGDRFLGVLLIIPTACAGALYPHLARHADAIRATWLAALGLGLVGAVLAAVGVLLAPTAVHVLFGDSYDDAVPTVRIMLLAAPLMFATAILMAGMFSGRHERRVLGVMLLGSVCGTGFVVTGQALFGEEGAALGYVVRYVVFLLALGAMSIYVRADQVRSPSTQTTVSGLEGDEPSDVRPGLPPVGA